MTIGYSLIKDIYLFIRTPNLVMIAVAMWFLRKLMIGGFLGHYGLSFHLPGGLFSLLVADVILVAIGGYWINDFFDRATDRINRPTRFMVKHNVGPGGFFVMYTFIVLMGALLGYYIARRLGYERLLWIYPAAVAGLYIYARWLKQIGWAGNVMVSAMIAFVPWLLLIAEWPAMREAKTFSAEAFSLFIRNVLIYSALMFFSNLAREFCKDAEDVEGDRETGIRTIPIQLGFGWTNAFIIGALVITMLLEFVLLRSANLDEILWAVGTLIMGMGVALSFMAFRAGEKTAYTRLSKWLKVFMLVGILQLMFITI